MNTPSTVASGATTSPFFVNSDGWVVIKPATGATVLVEYTIGAPSLVAAGGATWISRGSYTVNAAFRVEEELSSVYFRLTASGGTVSYSVEGELDAADRQIVNSYVKGIVNSISASYAYDASGNFTGLPGPSGALVIVPRPAGASLSDRIAVVGDSFAQQSNGGTTVGITCTRSNGVVTVTGATSHPFYPGQLCTAVGFLDPANEVQNVPVASYISSSSFTYTHAGADGVMAERSANSSLILTMQSYLAIGFWSSFNRLTLGAYRLVANAGFPGATTEIIATKVAKFVTPLSPDRCVYLGGYNDFTAGLTVAQTVAAIKSAVDLVPCALWDIFSSFPFLAGSANNTAANLRKLSQYYPALKTAFASYPNVRVHDSLMLFGLSTGLAKTGYIGSDNIHPTQRCMYEAAKYLVALDSVKQTVVALPLTALDTYGVISSSKNLIDNPLMTGSGGSVLTNVTGTVPTGGSGALTGTGASGASTTPARADGFGNDWQIVYTPANADNALRMSFSGLNARFTSGQTIDQIVMRVSVTNLVAGNVKQVNAVVVWIADGVTYASAAQDSSGSGAAIANMQQDDIAELVFTFRNVAVPVFASLTLARFDLTTSHVASSASAVTVKLGQMQVTLA